MLAPQTADFFEGDSANFGRECRSNVTPVKPSAYFDFISFVVNPFDLEVVIPVHMFHGRLHLTEIAYHGNQLQRHLF